MTATATTTDLPLERVNRDAARDAGLVYVADLGDGIRREPHGRRGKGTAQAFRYVTADGAVVRDEATLARIRALVIPPAWTDVRIAASPRGHIQAIGRDARGRKQYRYHARWREVRDETKYGQLVAFGRALPALRRRVQRDLARPGLPREKVLAAVVRLLELTRVRVGNEEYAKSNGSFGLTTLRDRHADIRGAEVRFEFTGKSGKHHAVGIQDRRLARIVKACQDIPGQELFQYVDDDGTRRSIGSADVNAYLREITAEDFTAKMFRTWAGTVEALVALRKLAPCLSAAQAKRDRIEVTKQVAALLNNTPAVCRKCYIHPAVFECWERGDLERVIAGLGRAATAPARGLSPDERLALAFLADAARAARRRAPRLTPGAGAARRRAAPASARARGARGPARPRARAR